MKKILSLLPRKLITIYDVNLIWDQDFLTWGGKFRLTREWYGTAPNGIEFHGYLDDSGAIRAFFPEIK